MEKRALLYGGKAEQVCAVAALEPVVPYES